MYKLNQLMSFLRSFSVRLSIFSPERSFRTRIIVVIAIIFMGGIWTLSFYTSEILKSDMARSIGAQQYSTASLIATGLSRQVQDRIDALEHVAAKITPAMIHDLKALQLFLDNQTSLPILYNDGVIVYNTDGIAISSAPLFPSRLGISYADRDYISRTLQTGVYTIGSPVVGKTLKVPVFLIGMPIKNAQNDVIGVISGVINLEKPNFLNKIIGHAYGSSGSYMLISANTRQIITATDERSKLDLLPAPGLNRYMDRILSGYEGSLMMRNSLGVWTLTSSKKIDNTDWIVLITLPGEEAFEPIVSMQIRMFIATLFLTFFISISIWFIMRQHFLNLETATDMLINMSKSKGVATMLPIYRQDEVGILITGFNNLLSTLNQRESFLKQILDTSNVAIFLIDLTGHITKANQRMSEMFGYSVEQLEGMEYVQLLHPNGREEALSLVKSLPDNEAMHVEVDRLYWKADQLEFWGHLTGRRFYDSTGLNHGLLSVISDINDRKLSETLITKKILSLTQPIESGTITLDDLFKKDEIQRIQDEFANATGVASLITYTNGNPFTQPSNFTNFCTGIRNTPEGCKNCIRSDSIIGRYNNEGPILQVCSSGGLWDAGVSIQVGGQHVGNWLIGQVRNERQQMENMLSYAVELGIDPDIFRQDFENVPVMSYIQFELIAKSLHTLASQLSMTAFNNIQQARVITERRRSARYSEFRSRTLELVAGEESLSNILMSIAEGVEQIDSSMKCSISLVTEDGSELINWVAPSLSQSYVASIKRVPIMYGEGSCGTAAYIGERVIVEDIRVHPLWEKYRNLALSNNLLSCWSQPIMTPDNNIQGVFSVYHTIPSVPSDSELEIIEQASQVASLAISRKHADEKLHLAASVFSHAREGIIISSPTGIIIDVNYTGCTVTGYTRDELLGQNFQILRSPKNDIEEYELLWSELEQYGYWHGEVWNQRKNGNVYIAMQTISAVHDSDGSLQHYVVLFSDITNIKDHEKQLEHIAHYDVLTSLPNRVLLSNCLANAMLHAQQNNTLLAIAYLDLDGFKAVNDTFGHDVGDQLLITVANSMQSTLRDGDILARLGGDEFVAIFLDLVNLEDSHQMLTRLLNSASQTALINNISPIQISASVGVTFYPQYDTVDADQLLRQADQAMYQAKLSGKNRYHIFDAEEDRYVRGHHESIAHIKKAMIERDFVLYYQPKVNMRTGAVIGMEALIRWQHVERGLLSPSVFLPVIEDHHLAVDIGEWVLDTVLTQLSKWNAEGLHLPVSINVGARQLQQPNFVARVKSILEAYPEIHSGSLEMEILETSALADLASISQVIESCRKMGIKFSLDDFGTGYSSLTYLKRLAVDQLKLDQSFVIDMLHDSEALVIVCGVVSLAKAFRREVIAEGVETIAHGKLLLELGCDLAQGYGISRPMPADEVVAWVAGWIPDSSWKDVSVLNLEELPQLLEDRKKV